MNCNLLLQRCTPLHNAGVAAAVELFCTHSLQLHLRRHGMMEKGDMQSLITTSRVLSVLRQHLMTFCQRSCCVPLRLHAALVAEWMIWCTLPKKMQSKSRQKAKPSKIAAHKQTNYFRRTTQHPRNVDGGGVCCGKAAKCAEKSNSPTSFARQGEGGK